MLEDSGFRVSRVIEDKFDLRYQEGGAMFNHSLTKFGFLDAWRRVVNPEDEVQVFALLEKKLSTIARRRGELRMSVPMLYVEGTKATTNS